MPRSGNKMKITVVGAGNAGCWTALHLAYYCQNQFEVELIYDPSVPAEPVGQGTLPGATNLLWNSLGCNWFNNPIEATPKTGILYEGWGKKKESYFHPFPLNIVAMHYEPSKLHKAILGSKLFSVKEEKVKDCADIDSDYIIDASGKPENFEEYQQLDNPINCCLAGRTSTSNRKHILWTRSIATPDGWCFVIPNNDGSESYGYLFNSEWTEEKEAMKNMSEYVQIENTKKINFKNYLAKQPIKDERVIKAGNKHFFLEPLEATALKAYSHWSRLIYDYMVTKTLTSNDCTNKFNKYIKQTETFVAAHYAFGSKYDSKFWNECTKRYDIKSHQFSRLRSIASQRGWNERDSERKQNSFPWAQWENYSIGQWFEAMSE